MKKIISAFLLFTVMLTCSSCSFQAKAPEKYTMTGFAMDTVIQTTLYTSGEDISLEITEELTALENDYLSRTRAISEIYRINAATDETQQISEPLSGWLRDILDLAEVSGGAVDPTMGEVIRLWNIDGENPHVPDSAELSELLSHVDYRRVSLEDRTLCLPMGCTLDLGAVGKGIGCDAILTLLQSDKSISGALLSMGGSSVMTYGSKPNASDWNIAIKDPRDTEGDYLGIVTLSGTKFLSTSGDYEKFFIEDGVRYHHILDPATGFPSANGICSATVVCSSGLKADGLSTACMVLGKEKAAALLKACDADGMLVDENGQIYLTEGMQKLFSLWKENYTVSVF